MIIFMHFKAYFYLLTARETVWLNEKCDDFEVKNLMLSFTGYVALGLMAPIQFLYLWNGDNNT